MGAASEAAACPTGRRASHHGGAAFKRQSRLRPDGRNRQIPVIGLGACAAVRCSCRAPLAAAYAPGARSGQNSGGLPACRQQPRLRCQMLSSRRRWRRCWEMLVSPGRNKPAQRQPGRPQNRHEGGSQTERRELVTSRRSRRVCECLSECEAPLKPRAKFPLG